jgi:Protein of unknown function (DUF1217)
MDPTISTLGIPDGIAGWNLLQTKTPADFPALTKDPVVQREISYFEQNAPKATTAQALLADPRLQDFVLTAYGLTSESGFTALMQKVLNSNPTQSTSFAAQLSDSRFTQIATAFNYGGASTPVVPPVASTAEVAVDGLYQQSNFSSFSGTFGGVSVSNVDVSGATTYQGLANTLQAALRRADGNRGDISVTLDGTNLKFSDAKGRGTASAFAWIANPANTQVAPTAPNPTSLVAGAAAVAATGGPTVTSATFINQVVQKYTEAQFETVVGNTSNPLREALYAKQQLPNITNWYSLIANPALANVIQTVLGLPASFGAVNVDQQAQTLAQRMSIKDFQDPAKLSKLLTQFVALSGDQTQNTSASSALQLLSSTQPSNGIINLTLPTAGSATDSFSSGSSAALLFST